MTEKVARGHRIIALALLSLLLTPLVAAQSGHLTLLTVGERADGSRVGGTADLYLVIKPGSGQIFIDTQPLTRIDTQSSARYANKVACAYTGADCSSLDFFYTIRSDSSVVGGPSAGAAIAVLTASLLEGATLNESVAITGTINSGGIIGPVAGEQEKITAAKAAGITTVLLSAFSTPSKVNESYLTLLNESKEKGENTSINLSLLSTPLNLSSFGIRVVQVSTLDEAMGYFTGKRHHKPRANLEVPASYTVIMRRVAHTLCGRRDDLLENVSNRTAATSVANTAATSVANTAATSVANTTVTSVANTAATSVANTTVTSVANTAATSTTIINASRLNQSRTALEQEDWYSAASYCFGDLIKLRTALLEQQSPEELEKLAQSVNQWITSFRKEVAHHPLATLGDLETKLIVTERLDEASRALNTTNLTASVLGFAYERAYSAEAWSAFFAMKGPVITLDPQHTRQACEEKIAESRERASYIGLYLPAQLLNGVNEELKAAEEEARNGKYEACLFRAARATAEANLLAGSLAVDKQKLQELITKKLEAARQVISDESERGFFPILGYSYYRYAASLAENDPYSALTFAEQALELSDLDIYFPQRASWNLPVWFWQALLFLSGFLLGGALMFIATKRGLAERRKKGVSKNHRGRRT